MRNPNFLSDDVIKRNIVHIYVPDEIYEIFADKAEQAKTSVAKVFSQFLSTVTFEDFRCAVDNQGDFTGSTDIATRFNNQQFTRLRNYAKRLGVPVNQMVKQYVLMCFRYNYTIKVKDNPIVYRKYVYCEQSFRNAIVRLKERYCKLNKEEIPLSRFITKILTGQISIDDIKYKCKRKDSGTGKARIYLSFTELEYKDTTQRGVETSAEIRALLASTISKK